MLKPDPALSNFSSRKQQPEHLEKEFRKEQPRFLISFLQRSFDMTSLHDEIKYHLQSYQKDEKKSAKQRHKPWARDLEKQLREIRNVADKFQVQLKSFQNLSDPQWLSKLQERIQAARFFFDPRLDECSEKIQSKIQELQQEVGVKKYIRELKDLQHSFFSQKQAIQKAMALLDAIINNREISRASVKPEVSEKNESETSASSPKKTNKKHKEKKQGTREISYQLFQQGKSVEQIASDRGLAVSTIEGHLSYWVSLGEIDVAHFLNNQKLEQIIRVAQQINSTKLGDIKARLGDEFTYSDLKFAMAQYHLNQEKKETKTSQKPDSNEEKDSGKK